MAIRKRLRVKGCYADLPLHILGTRLLLRPLLIHLVTPLERKHRKSSGRSGAMPMPIFEVIATQSRMSFELHEAKGDILTGKIFHS